jgi:hypothetical protein
MVQGLRAWGRVWTASSAREVSSWLVTTEGVADKST